eukprot:6478684-Prymnesium_polylepis.2
MSVPLHAARFLPNHGGTHAQLAERHEGGRYRKFGPLGCSEQDAARVALCKSGPPHRLAHPTPSRLRVLACALAASGGYLFSVLYSACVASLGRPGDRHLGGAEIRSKVSRSCLAASVRSDLSPP